MIAPVLLHIKVPQDNPNGPASMANVLDGLGELFRKKKTTFGFEIVLRGGFLYFFAVSERASVDLIRGQLFSQYPHLELTEVADYAGTFGTSSTIATVKLERPDVYPLKTYKDLPNDLLTNLSGLATSVAKDETVAIQLVLESIDTDAVGYKLRAAAYSALHGGLQYEKLSETLFGSTIRVAAHSTVKSDALATSVLSLFKLLDNTNVNDLKIWKKTNNPQGSAAFSLRTPAKKTFRLSSAEVATLFHLPFTGAAIAQVSQVKTKTAEPPNELPVAPGVIPFAQTNFRGVETEFGIKREDRRKHLYIVGKTGVGKSKLIELLALADIKEGKGCVVMDPHGDLAEELLRYVPRERLYDVIYFNPADTDFPMSFNPLEGVGSFEFRQNVVFGFISIFKKLFGFTWNQRLEHVLRFTTLALLDVPGATVLGITKMLSNTQYRQEVIAKIQDPLVKKFWSTEFSSWNDQYAGEAITPIINKVGQFVANPVIRNIVGQAKSTIKIDEIINNEKILIANFSIGKLGEENSALLGAMFITKLWQAALARASIPEADRKDTYLYVDEFQNFATSAFANILSEARKYRLNVTVAHQYMKQLPEEVRSTVFGNVRSIMSFRVGGEDAAILEKEYTPTFVPEDFMNLDMRNFYVKMIIDGQTARPFSGKTLDFPKPDNDLINDVIKISRERWATPRDQAEREVASQDQDSIAVSPTAPREFSEPLL